MPERTMAKDLHEFVMQQVLEIIAQDRASNAAKLANVTHLLGKYRAELVKNHILRRTSLEVQRGPFAGMRFLDRVAEGCYVPKLLGCYEAELHSTLEECRTRGFECVLNIGCAEGYYAVGLARLLPELMVYAHDQNQTAQTLCRRLAEHNGVAERVQVGGLFSLADFARFVGRRTLLICDIEGAELELLNPVLAPALSEFDILVEMHNLGGRNVSDELLPRFTDSHDVEVIPHGGRDPSQFPVLDDLSHLDQLIALWEWRGGPTPWAMLRTKNVTRS